MAALTMARNTITSRVRSGDLLRIPMAADTVIFLGSIVNIDPNGYAVPGADTHDHKFAGIAYEDTQDPTATAADGKYDNGGGAAGAKEVVVCWRGRARLFLLERTPSQLMLAAMVYVADDQSLYVHIFDATNDIECGQVVRCPGTTLLAHPTTQMEADELEIEFQGAPWDYMGGTTSTTTSGA